MRRLPRILIILAFLLSTPNLVFANVEPDETDFYPGISFRFEKLTIDNGLSQNAGLALLQDSQGFLWIGTQDGLNRYSGVDLLQFKNDPDDSNSISHNSVISLFEDYEGMLWIGTWGGGLNRMDLKTSQIDRFLPDEDNPDFLANGTVTAISEDQNGHLWIGTQNGLEMFDRESGKFIHFKSMENNPDTLSSNVISTIVPANDGKLWIGTGSYNLEGKGLNLFDPNSGKAKRYQDVSPCMASANVSSIVEMTDGNLWVGYGGYAVSGGGLAHFNPSTNDCEQFLNENDRGQIVDNNVTDILIDQNQTLWVTMWNSGLFYKSLDNKGGFQSIQHDAGDFDSLSSNNTYSLLLDHSNVLWIGTLSSGINKINLLSLQFRTYRNNGNNPNSIRSNHIGTFSETSDGTVWVGTWDSGLARFESSSGSFTHFQFDSGDENSISSDLVMSLFTDHKDQLWIGTLGGGLNRYDEDKNQFIRFMHDESGPSSLIDNQVTNIVQDKQERLWIMTMGGLSRKDPGDDGFINYPFSENGLGGPLVSAMIDGDHLWVGTWGAGLYQMDLSDPKNLDPKTANWQIMKNDPEDSNTLSDNSVWVIHKSSTGLIWLGTQSGLNRFDPQTQSYRHFTEKDGFRNTTILGILEDDFGNLWITTNNGLVKFDPVTERVQIYDKANGLQGNEFNSNGYYKSLKTGDFYVGGTNGFTVFNPLDIVPNQVAPNIVITDFKVFNESFPFNVQSDETIALTYKQNFISFEFAALDFQSPKMNQYAYQLENFDPGWVVSGTRNFASYTNLPGGEYTFKVKAANNNGIWNETGVSIKLKIIPPFWQTWQFRLGGLLFLSIIGFSLASLRTKEIRKQKRKLEEEVFQRTSELKQAQLELKQRAEKDLSVSEARFQTMFENSPVGMGILKSRSKNHRFQPSHVRDVRIYTGGTYRAISGFIHLSRRLR